MHIVVLTVSDSWRGAYYYDRGLVGGFQTMGHTATLRTAETYRADDRPQMLLARCESPSDLAHFLETHRPRNCRMGAIVSGRDPDQYRARISAASDFGITPWTLAGLGPYGVGFPIAEVPPACDLPRFHLQIPATPRWDVCYVGSNSPDKRRLRRWVEPALRDHTHCVSGPGWWERGFKLVDLQPREVVRASKICLNIHDDISPGSPPNQRLFQYAAWGKEQIADHHPRLREFFGEDEILSAESPAEYGELTRGLVQGHGGHAACARIARAMARVKREHNFTARARSLLKWLKEV